MRDDVFKYEQDGAKLSYITPTKVFSSHPAISLHAHPIELIAQILSRSIMVGEGQRPGFNLAGQQFSLDNYG